MVFVFYGSETENIYSRRTGFGFTWATTLTMTNASLYHVCFLIRVVFHVRYVCHMLCLCLCLYLLFCVLLLSRVERLTSSPLRVRYKIHFSDGLCYPTSLVSVVRTPTVHCAHGYRVGCERRICSRLTYTNTNLSLDFLTHSSHSSSFFLLNLSFRLTAPFCQIKRTFIMFQSGVVFASDEGIGQMDECARSYVRLYEPW
jgi:hypothetical protein